MVAKYVLKGSFNSFVPIIFFQRNFMVKQKIIINPFKIVSIILSIILPVFVIRIFKFLKDPAKVLYVWHEPDRWDIPGSGDTGQ